MIHSDLQGVKIHYVDSLEDSTEHDFRNAKTFRKKTTIKAVQIGCPFEVETLEGLMQGKAGDWLAVGVKGELYPIAANVFEKTYEPSSTVMARFRADIVLSQKLRSAIYKVATGERYPPSAYFLRADAKIVEEVAIELEQRHMTMLKEGLKK